MQSFRGGVLGKRSRCPCLSHRTHRSCNLQQALCQSSNAPLNREQPQRPSTVQLKTALPQRALVQLPVREAKVVENESNVNKKLLASAAAVCLATNFLTVQGLLLTTYAAALTVVPVGAVRHALKKRNIWPAMCLLSSFLLVPNVPVLRGAYMSLVNPVSVQLKARITLPAVVHAFVGSKHPILRGTLQAAQVASQLILVGLLLQYLLAPKIAETMRQRAIMLCRALTTTESQALKKEMGKTDKGDKEAWVNTKPSHVDPAMEPSEGTDSGFLGSISRGTPRPREAMAADLANKAPRRRKPALNLPEGQQPSIDDIYSHTQGLEYAFVAAGKQATAAAGQAHGLSPIQNAEFQDLFQTPSEEEIQQARADLAELGLSFESEADPPNNDGTENAQLDSVVGSITSTEELFAVLNEQLNMVQDLADEVRHKGIALRQSEYAREDLLRELKATVGEKNLISKELSHLALKFEAAQSMWEKHLEQGGSFSDLITEEVLDKVVDALNERKRHLLVDYVELNAEEPPAVAGQDAIAAKFRVFPDEPSPVGEEQHLNNVQPFEREQRQSSAETESSKQACVPE